MRMLLERYYEAPVSAGFDKLGFSPNGVTILGLIVTLISAIFISLGMFLVGGIVMLIGSALDLIDGGLARRLGKVSNFGALLDSVIDRFQEALVFLGGVWGVQVKGTRAAERRLESGEQRDKAPRSGSAEFPLKGREAAQNDHLKSEVTLGGPRFLGFLTKNELKILIFG